MSNFVRTIRLRSTVDAEFKPSYNRLSYKIDDDDFSSDLSQSYLALRMYLTTKAGVKYTKEDFAALATQNVYVSFGQNDQSYSPLCLIKTARLFNGNRSMVLEEVQFANVLYTTLHQLLNDFESIASSSLTSNTAVTFGAPQSAGAMFANLLEDYIGSGEQIPIEIHLPLKDIFGFFKSKNVYLNDPALMGLYLDFELEDQKSLFHSQVISEKQIVPTPLLPVHSDDAGMIASLANNPFCSLTSQNNVGQATQGILPTCVPDASGNFFEYKTPTKFEESQIQQPSLRLDGNPVSTFTLLGTWTAPLLASLDISSNQYVKLNFRITPTGGLTNIRQDKIVSRIDKVVTLAIAGNGTLNITLEHAYSIMLTDTQHTASLDSIEFIETIELNPVFQAGFQNLWSSGVITISNATLTQLKVMGAVSNAGVPLPTKFNLYAQTLGFDVSGNTPTEIPVQITHDVFLNPDSLTGRHCVSNSLKSMPLQGGTCQILSVVANGMNWDVTFKNLGMVNNNSLYDGIILNSVVLENGDAIPPNTFEAVYDFFITDYNSCNATAPYRSVEDYSYMIDKAELVLVQSAKDKSVPMSRVYTTSKVEVTTIETAVPYYNRQFVVTEPNVYNLLLCTPQYVVSATQPESLISQRRGVAEYRWSINNIDATNRLIEVGTNTSFYPSSLYLESLMDVMGNASVGLKSFAGALTVPHSDTPVVMYPQRIYKATDGMNYFFRPSGFTAQVTLIGDIAHTSQVTAGNIFLFKQCVKMF
jgi:hypothetical protein